MRYLGAISILAVLMSASALAEVSVRKSPPAIQYKTFDPAKPPAELPHLAPPEVAVTVCGFGFSAQPTYEVVSRQRGADGNWTAVVAINGVAIYVRLSVVVWTPKGVSNKVKAHEEGHRKLDEMMYKKLAENAARAAGAAMDGQRFSGLGPTAEKAVANAIQAMFQQAGHDYLARTAAVNEEINVDYDAITQHGTNDVPESEAMTRAVTQYEHEHPETCAAFAPVITES